MSDYIYLLESHLNPEQKQALAAVVAAAGQAGVNVFLTGGAMRDMLAGFPVRDLDFVVEGPALKLANQVAHASGAELVGTDDVRKSAALVFPGGVTAEIAMARKEKYARAGAKPQISPATIQEDLRGRDFTANAVALSLNKSSRGLLLDPTNGLADIERRELRAVSPYGFYDDPQRLLRLVRFAARLGFTVDERTAMQVANAREAGAETGIAPAALAEEMRRIATEDLCAQVVKGLEEAGLMPLFSAVFAAGQADIPSLEKLEQTLGVTPADPEWRAARLGPFLCALTGNLSAKEKAALTKELDLPPSWTKLEAKAKKLETALRAPSLRRPSQVYATLLAAAPEEVIFLLPRSPFKPVQERLHSYFEKYLPAAQALPAEELAGIAAKPGTPRYAKERDAILAKWLDRKPKKEEPEPVVEAPAPLVEVAAGRRGGGR